MPTHDHLLKLLLVGDSGVGKTCLLISFTQDQFDSDKRPTIGVDLKVKVLLKRDKRIKLTIWDTAGQERFRTLTSAYYRGAQGVILVYDVTDRASFEHVEEWLQEVDIFTSKESVVKCLVGNKIDLDARKMVSRQEGSDFARKHEMLFFEASAKTRAGVQDAFEELVEKILDSPALRQSEAHRANSVIPGDADPNGNSGACGCF